MAFVQIPLSNTLRIVRTDNQGSNLQSHDNRLLSQLVYEDYNDKFYAQKINSTDDILIQFGTDYTTITAVVYNLDGTVASDKTASVVLNTASTTFDIYDLSFTISAEGYYYLVLDFDTSTEVYQSEVFQIDSFDTARMLKIEYNTSDNDGITYNDSQTFVINIEGRLAKYLPGQKKETYTNYNESLVNLNSFPTRGLVLEYGFLPEYMVEKLNLALSHGVFKINNVEYQSEGGPDAELMEDGNWITNMYKGEVQLQQVTYESYTLATDDEEPTIYPILVDEFETVLILKNEGTEYYAQYKT